jgi:hypothetical protein
MTPEQQRIAIAEACGWTEIEPCTCCYGVSRGYQPIPAAHKKHVPDYLNDLNDMHEAEKVLTSEQVTSYVDSLESMNERWSTPAFATASQRAEAFLRTIGKWQEAKP